MRRRTSQLDTGDGSKTAGGIVSGLPAVTSKRSKYNNVRVNDPNHGTFDSKAEHKRFLDLLLLERAGEISRLERQPRLNLTVNGHKLGFYKADFCYFDTKAQRRVYEDKKGVRTPLYKFKARLIFALYGITILET
jgi:hypothetical protein